MTKPQLCRALAISGLLGLQAGWIPAHSVELVTLASGEWAPYTSKNLPNDGFYSEIVRQAFALEGYQVHYSYFPWARAYMYVEQGEVDGSLTWAKTEKKEQDVLFSDPVFWHRKVFFHLKSMPFDWQDIDDLRGIKIGITDQYSYGEAFDLAVEKNELQTESTSSDLSNLNKILTKRIAIFPSDILAGRHLLDKHYSPEQASQVSHHPKPIQYTSTHVVFSKSKPARSKLLLAAFNRGLKKLRSSGKYQNIYKQANITTKQPIYPVPIVLQEFKKNP